MIVLYVHKLHYKYYKSPQCTCFDRPCKVWMEPSGCLAGTSDPLQVMGIPLACAKDPWDLLKGMTCKSVQSFTSQCLVIYFYKSPGCDTKCSFLRGRGDVAQLRQHPGSPPDPRDLVRNNLPSLFTKGHSSRQASDARQTAGTLGC